MQDIILNIIIIIGICFLIMGVGYQALKLPKDTRRKITLNYIVDNLVECKILKPAFDLITRNKTSFINSAGQKLLELSESAINLQKLYFIKTVCLVTCAVVALAISYTNAGYEIKQIVGAPGTRDYVNNQETSYDESRYKLFSKVMSDIGENKFSKSSESIKYNLVQAEIAEQLNTTDKQIINEYTDWFLDKWNRIKDIKVFRIYHIWTFLISFFLPEIFLIFRWLLRGSVYKKEIIKLEYIFELLARIDGVKTIDIIEQMEKSSKIYSKCLNDFSKIFKYDKRKGFDYLHNKKIKSLSKLSEILEVYSLTDKEIALQILEREVIERDEAMIMTADETVDFIDLVAFLSIVPLVYELVMLMLRPMLDVVYKAFEFI